MTENHQTLDREFAVLTYLSLSFTFFISIFCQMYLTAAESAYSTSIFLVKRVLIGIIPLFVTLEHIWFN